MEKQTSVELLIEQIKSKAEQLVNSFRIVLMKENTECGNEILCTLIAKQNALIAVDEIISIVEWYDIRHISNQLKFWIEVKNEIEKL